MKFDTTNNLPLTTAPQKISLRETEKIKANPVEIRKEILDYLSAAGTLLGNSLLKWLSVMNCIGMVYNRVPHGKHWCCQKD